MVERIGDEAKDAPRQLTAAEEANVAAKVSAFRGQQFFGQIGTSIPDGRILWASIVKALQDGEWQLVPADGATGNPPASDAMGGPDGVAVFVTRGDTATVPAANALILALRGAGLKKVEGGYSDKPEMAPKKIKIAIGVRPAE